MDRLKSLTAQELEKVNQVILNTVAKQQVPLITQVTHHIIQSGGKRLRPTLTLACAQLIGYDGEQHIGLAATVELIHTATLLHDDVVDESTMRRGLETANHVWSNQTSVLVGDFLLSRAFQLMVSHGSLPVLKLLSDASATISSGEVKQLMVTGNLETQEADYLDVIESKTATLFEAACAIAPLLTGQDVLREPFARFGRCLGIAFQLVDDALDYSATQEQLGKRVGDDLREGKITLPVIHAYKHGTAKERQFWQRVIGEGVFHDTDVSEAVAILNRHQAIEITLERARSYTEEARHALHTIKGANAPAAALEECLDFCLARAM